MNLKIVALGGLEENGKNCYIIEGVNDIIVIDMGNKKFDNRTLGVDTIINDISYLKENKNKIKALLVSHAHVDQTGGVRFLLDEIKVPVYGSEYTIEYLKNEYKYDKYNVINDSLKLGEFVIEHFSLAHSVFGTLGFLIAQGKDAVVYASDYNFSQARKEKVRTDIEKIVNLKQRYNIKVLMTESICADQPGTASADFSFLTPFNRIAKNTKGKMFISLYSSNILGMVNIMHIAEENKKKIVIVGKDLLTFVNVSRKLGYIDHKYDMFIKIKDIPKYDSGEIIVVVSGDFLEPFESLSNMAKQQHPITTITENDTVIIASEPYDEIEGTVQKIIDKISRTNCSLTNLNVSIPSNAFQEDIKMMINLFYPEYVMPIKGEYRKMEKTKEICTFLEYPENKIIIVENGDVVKVDKKVYTTSHIKLAPKLKNMNLKETVNPILLSDRENLTSEGYVLITIVVKRGTNVLLQEPEIFSGGLMSFGDDNTIMEKTIEIATKELESGVTTDSVIKVKNKVRRFLNNKIGKMPTVLTVKIEVK